MGATSVTGVSGIGSVAGMSKGSEEMSLGVGHLIGPRVKAAGTVTVGAGTGATAAITATNGVITSVTVVGVGSGYPANSTVYLLVTGGNGSSGVITGTTGTAGTIVSFSTAPLIAGATYTTTTAATAVTGMVFMPEGTLVSPNTTSPFDSPGYAASVSGGDPGDDAFLNPLYNYIGYANDTNPVPALCGVAALTTNYLVLTGTAGHVLNWMIVKTGL